MTLYQRILGDEFFKLAPLIQQMHAYEKKQVFSGQVQVVRGKSLVAKLLNFLMKLPKAQSHALLKLELKEENEKELWRRTFGDEVFYSTQYQVGQQMVEQVAGVKMYFDVYVQDASMHSVLKKSTLFGLSVPKKLSVNISSIIREENGKIIFAVEVSSFGAKQVIDYGGVIEL